MKFTRVVAIAVIAGSFGIGALQAQTFRTQPNEYPPASYKGKQFVDSSGCVFIRAGIDGNVTWVPRVSRKRQGVCGFKPTNVGTAAASPPAQTTAPVQITLNDAPAAQPAARVAAVQPRPMPKAARVQPAAIQRAQPVIRQQAPQVVRQTPVRIAAPAPKIVTAPKVVSRGGSCPGRSAISQQYSGGGAGLPVRCGPQAQPVVNARVATPMYQAQPSLAGGYGAGTASVTQNTRIVPKHVAINRINTISNVQVPKGYKSVWDDDRLNPKRAEQTLAGRSQMLLIWTNTLPRRLINQSTGRDVTAQVPLVYPYTSVEQQRRELGEVTLATRNGQLVKRIVRNTTAAPVVRTPTYSSRSAAKPAAAAPVQRAQVQNGGSTYVQVGLFQNQANAQKTAQHIARMGMGARIGKSTRGGKTYLSVQAGPFPQASASGAVGKLRGAGFKDAYIR